MRLHDEDFIVLTDADLHMLEVAMTAECGDVDYSQLIDEDES